MPSCCRLKRAVGVAPTLISSTGGPSRSTSAASRVSVCASLGRNGGDLALRSGAVAVAGVAEQPAEPQPRQLGDARDEFGGAAALRIDAAAMKADVHLDQHVDLALVHAHQARPAPRDIEVVDDEREPRAIEELEDAGGVGRVDRVGKPDVVDAGRGEDFGLAELRAADADRAARDLHAREVRRLVRLGVRPEADAPRVRRRLHAVDVLLEARLVDEDRRGAEVAELHGASVAESGIRDQVGIRLARRQ